MRTLLLLLAPLAAFAQTPAVVDRIAVVVGSTVITESEVLQEVRLEALLNNAPLDLGSQARRTAADRLVDQQLIRNEMRVGGYAQPTPADIDSMLAGLRKDHWPTDDQYRAALARYGVTEPQLRDYLGWQLSAIRFTDVRFGATQVAAAAPPATDNQSANRAAPAPEPPANIDQQLDTWLKQTRAGVKVQFKDGAFQ